MCGRVLLLIDALGSGGAERQMTNLAIGLKSIGYEIRLIEFSSEKPFYDQFLVENGVTAESNKRGANKLIRPFVISKIVRDWKPKAVIAYKDGVCMAACLARCMSNFKLIVSERNTTQQLTFRERLKFQLYRFSEYIVPNSYSQEKFVCRHFPFLAHKLRTIVNTIDTTTFSPAMKSPSNTLKIITVARVMPQKNVLTYLIAISMLEKSGFGGNVHFEWYGNMSDTDYVTSVQKEIGRLGIGDMISFHEPVKDVERIYRSANIFCLPSLYEGFPNVLCEAMSTGLFVIASAVCDNPIILQDKENGFLFDPNSPSDISQKIIKAIKLSGIERHKTGQRNREKIQSICGRDVFLNRYASLIEE